MKSYKSGLLLGFFLFSSLFLFSSISFSKHDGGACKTDIEKFCSNVSGDRGAKMKCLSDHQKELSSECQAKLEMKKKRMEEFKKDCGGDVEKFCSGIEAGRGKKWECLKTHQSQLSSACQQRLEAKQKKL